MAGKADRGAGSNGWGGRMKGSGSGKILKVVGIVVGVIVVGAGVAVGVYCDNNLHAEERMISKALDSGFTEKQATVNGATINYAEGPNNGPALVLVHGQGMEWED